MAASKSSPARIGWLAALSPQFLRAPSVVMLIAVNLLPLYGVLFWGWDLYSLMILYWMETGVIGFFAILQMALLAGWFALFLVPFFIVHFGGFMLGHFLFLTLFFGPAGGTRELEKVPEMVLALLVKQGLWIALAALAISHLVSFILNVLWPRWERWRDRAARAFGAYETRDTQSPQNVMGATYGLVVVLHVSILFGAVLAELFRTKVAAFVLLIALKTIIDVAAHVRRNFQPVPVAG